MNEHPWCSRRQTHGARLSGKPVEEKYPPPYRQGGGDSGKLPSPAHGTTERDGIWTLAFLDSQLDVLATVSWAMNTVARSPSSEDFRLFDDGLAVGDFRIMPHRTFTTKITCSVLIF